MITEINCHLEGFLAYVKGIWGPSLAPEEKVTTTWPTISDSTRQVPFLADSQRQEVTGYERGSTFELLQAAAALPCWRDLMKHLGKPTQLLHKLLCYWRAYNSEDTNVAVFMCPTCSSKEMLKSHTGLWTAKLMTSDFPELSGWIADVQ